MTLNNDEIGDQLFGGSCNFQLYHYEHDLNLHRRENAKSRTLLILWNLINGFVREYTKLDYYYE